MITLRLICTHQIKLYPQNGGRITYFEGYLADIMTINSVTSLYHMYRVAKKVSDFFNTSYYLEPFKIIFSV